MPDAPMAQALDAVLRMIMRPGFRRHRASAQRSVRDGASGCFVLSRVLIGHPQVEIVSRAGWPENPRPFVPPQALDGTTWPAFKGVVVGTLER